MNRKWTVLLVLLMILAACSSADAMRRYFPDSLTGLSLREYTHGQDALEKVNALHGKGIEADAAAVAVYGNEQSSAEVWISRAADERLARQLMGEMVHLMYENPKSPFRFEKRFDYQGIAVYPFAGMGKSHLVFSRGDLVYWVTVAHGQERAALGDLF